MSIAKFNFRTKEKISTTLLLTNSQFENSSWLKINEIGKYIDRKVLAQTPELFSDRDIKLCKTDNLIKLYVDSDLISENQVDFKGNDVYFSIGAGNFDFYVDQIEIYDSNNELIFFDDFNFPASYPLIILLSIITSLFFLFRFKFKEYILMFTFSVSVIVLAYFACDYFYFTKLKQVKANDKFANQVVYPFLNWRNRFFDNIPHIPKYPSIYNSFLQHKFLYELFDLENRKNSSTDTITLGDYNSKMKWIFLGSSQASGEGATRVEYQLPYRLYNDLKNSFDQDIFFTSYTLKGFNAEMVYNYLIENKVNVADFNHLLISLGNNDVKGSKFQLYLEKIIGLAKLNPKLKIFLVHEPNTAEYPENANTYNHYILRELAASDSAIILLSSSDVSSQTAYESGDLWWDYVHMKNYGQFLYSKTLSSQISEILKPSN